MGIHLLPSSSYEHQTEDRALVCELYDTSKADKPMLLTMTLSWCFVCVHPRHLLPLPDVYSAIKTLPFQAWLKPKYLKQSGPFISRISNNALGKKSHHNLSALGISRELWSRPAIISTSSRWSNGLGESQSAQWWVYWSMTSHLVHRSILFIGRWLSNALQRVPATFQIKVFLEWLAQTCTDLSEECIDDTTWLLFADSTVWTVLLGFTSTWGCGAERAYAQVKPQLHSKECWWATHMKIQRVNNSQRSLLLTVNQLLMNENSVLVCTKSSAPWWQIEICLCPSRQGQCWQNHRTREQQRFWEKREKETLNSRW